MHQGRSVFDGLGKIKSEIQLQLEVDAHVFPKCKPPRRIPLATREQLRSTLEEIERRSVIKKEPEHTRWTSNILLVQKNNKFVVSIEFVSNSENLPDETTSKIYGLNGVKCIADDILVVEKGDSVEKQ